MRAVGDADIALLSYVLLEQLGLFSGKPGSLN